MRKHLALTLAVAALVSAVTPALAAVDKTAPKTILKAGDALQEGKRGDFCWGADGGQVGCTGPLDYEWPPAERVDAGVRSRIRIRRNDQPEQVTLTFWREVDDQGQPQEGDEGTELNYRLVKRERESGAVWDVRFRLPEEPGHFYLDMDGRWRDRDDGGEASYWFHLRLR